MQKKSSGYMVDTNEDTCDNCGVKLSDYEKQEFVSLCGICNAELFEANNPKRRD